jgi:hypothetical protein
VQGEGWLSLDITLEVGEDEGRSARQRLDNDARRLNAERERRTPECALSSVPNQLLELWR